MYYSRRGGQLKRELGDGGVRAWRRRGASLVTKGWELGDGERRKCEKYGLGRKLTLFGGRWETVGWEIGESTPPPCSPPHIGRLLESSEMRLGAKTNVSLYI